MIQAIRVHNYGESDVLTLEEIAQPEPQPNEVLIRVQAAAVNPLQALWKRSARMSKRSKSVKKFMAN